jgi:hypothetical protein
MQPLRITAWLATPMQAFDDWTPSLDSLLEWLILDKLGLASSNLTQLDIDKGLKIASESMPLDKREIQGESYWAVSAPQYTLLLEQNDRLRKRWDYNGCHMDWDGKSKKWSTSDGPTKSYDLLQHLRTTNCINWFAVGDLDGLRSLLNLFNAGLLGKRRQAIVWKWDVEPIEEDWHLWWGDHLMRPMPLRLLSSDPRITTQENNLMQWAWRSPYWLYSNKELCVMSRLLN